MVDEIVANLMAIEEDEKNEADSSQIISSRIETRNKSRHEVVY